MRRLPIFLSFFILANSGLRAQAFLIDIGGGVMNYGGDLQRHLITFNQSHPYIQGGMGVQINPHFATYLSLASGKVSASDTKAPITSKTYFRNLSFESNIGEVAINLEYNLIDITGMNNFTPYGFIGLGAFRFKPYAYDSAGNKVELQPLGTEGQEISGYSDEKKYNLLQFEIPFGVGVKYAITPNFFLCGEVGFRKLFTDYLDDVSSFNFADTAVLRAARGPQAAEMSYRAGEISGSKYIITNQRGNPDKKDSYYTFQIKLIISLDKSSFIL